jgi:hypothetical protein
VPHALPPKIFIRTIENWALILDKPEARSLAMAEVYNTKRDPKQVQAFVRTLRDVARQLEALIAVRQVTPKTIEKVHTEGVSSGSITRA